MMVAMDIEGVLQGDLSIMPLADLAIWLANRRMSGHLTIERGPQDGSPHDPIEKNVRKEFHLDRGHIIRASSTDPHERFGLFLVHYGLLTEDQLQRAHDAQMETNVLLGRILVMVGIVPEEQVIQFLRVKISESLLDGFRWTTGRFSLSGEVKPEARPEIEVRVPLVDLHREGATRMGTWEHFRRLFPDLDQELQVNEDKIPTSATPDTLDGRLLTLARHGLSIKGITTDLNATDYQVAARLYELHRMGVVLPRTIAPPPLKPPPRLATPEPSPPPAFDDALETSAIDPALKNAVPTVALRSTSPKFAPGLFTTKERYVLAKIDGKRTVEAILQLSPTHDQETLAILRKFEKDGLIKL